MSFIDTLKIPRDGIHALRIPYIDVAFWDTFLTIVVTVFVVLIFDKSASMLSIASCVALMFMIGAIVHRIIGIETKMSWIFNT